MFNHANLYFHEIFNEWRLDQLEVRKYHFVGALIYQIIHLFCIFWLKVTVVKQKGYFDLMNETYLVKTF